MQRIIILLFLFILSGSGLLAQPFNVVNSSIEGLGRSALSWGDYDNDGDLDLAACGEIPNGDYVSRVYINEEGAFTDIEAGMTGVREGSVEWGDYDNDNDLDLLLTGETTDAGYISLIYRNDDGIFVEYDPGLPQVGYGDAAWGDYDNDGDLDIMLSGNWETRLYENIAGSFTDTGNDFDALQFSKITWGDFDNDGDLDILLSGDTGGGYLSDIYINDDNNFVRAYLPLEGLFSGTSHMVDFDNDGDLDIALTGFDIYFDPRFLLYENLGDGTVTPYFTIMEGIAVSAVDWGDYDNDGDLDVIMAGKNASCGSSLAKVYRNDDGFFMMESSAQMDGMIRCSAAWADYDNDGDLDYILGGVDLSENEYTKLYQNEAGTNIYASNTLPEPPGGLNTVVNGQSVSFSWEKAVDAETPQDGLCYNIRLGLHSGESDIITPMADNESGYRYIQAIGNTNMQNEWTITRLEAGTYYWSVQTIDQAYSGSEFAAEETFQIIETGVNELNDRIDVDIYPNPATDKINIQFTHPGEIDIHILNTNGQLIQTETISSGDAVDISLLEEGVYFLYIDNGSKRAVGEFIKH